MNVPDGHLGKMNSTRAESAARSTPVVARLARNAAWNFEQWFLALARPPRAKYARPSALAAAAVVVTLVVIVASMFLIDATVVDWAGHEPNWVRDLFERVTDFGLSGWFLFPSGFLLLTLAALNAPGLTRLTQGVLAMLAARFGFLFLAIGLPGLFVAIVKRLIGRARPYVGGHIDPFAYRPFVWKPEYASMPSGHATTAVAAALAIGAIWPRTRLIMWLYAVTIVVSRVAVLAHHVSDVIAGALVAAVGVYLIRRWFAARRLVFRPEGLQACPAPSPRRIATALREAIFRL
ncbi:MAG TPA: phosphatase PAP2 family protein [Xanthobacteraceae bacterium]